MPVVFGVQHASIAPLFSFHILCCVHFGEIALNCPLVHVFHQSMSLFKYFTCLELATHPDCTLSHIKGSCDQPKTFLIFCVKFRINLEKYYFKSTVIHLGQNDLILFFWDLNFESDCHFMKLVKHLHMIPHHHRSNYPFFGSLDLGLFVSVLSSQQRLKLVLFSHLKIISKSSYLKDSSCSF